MASVTFIKSPNAGNVVMASGVTLKFDAKNSYKATKDNEIAALRDMCECLPHSYEELSEAESKKLAEVAMPEAPDEPVHLKVGMGNTDTIVK